MKLICEGSSLHFINLHILFNSKFVLGIFKFTTNFFLNDLKVFAYFVKIKPDTTNLQCKPYNKSVTMVFNGGSSMESKWMTFIQIGQWPW